MSGKPDTPARPARMSLSQVVEALLARGGGDRSSVTLARNAKGETQIEVVVRSSDAGEAITAHDCARIAGELYDSLRETYPLTPAEVPK